MKLLISTSAKAKPTKGAAPKWAKPTSISPAVEKKIAEVAKKSAKARADTLKSLERAVAAFKKQFPPIAEADMKTKLTSGMLKATVHPSYLDAKGTLVLPSKGGHIIDLLEDANQDLPLEINGADMLQEVHDIFRDYL